MEILRCPHCQEYTLRHRCPHCSQPAITPKPGRYSPEDKYGIWRRKAKSSKMQVSRIQVEMVTQEA